MTRITVSDINSEWVWHHSTRNNIRKNDTGLTGTMHYDIFRSITLLHTDLLHSIHCKHQFRILQYMIFVYTNWPRLWLYYTELHLNETLRRNSLGNSRFYGDLTRITVSDIKSEWIWHHSTRHNIRKNDTGLTGTMHCDIFRRITRLQTVLLHSIHCKHQFRILQYIIFVYTN